MSYALHIWKQPADQPWPATVDEAQRLLNALRDTKQGQNPTFIALASRLTARYPCITSPEAEAMPEDDWAWSDGPLDGRTDSAVYGVGIRAARWDEVQPFVIEQARALGLNVTDDSSGDVFLASGTTLRLRSPNQSAPGPAGARERIPRERIPRAHEIEAVVLERLTPLLEKHGFRAIKTKGEYKRAFPGGWHIVTVSVGDDSAAYPALTVSARSRFHVVQDLIAAILRPERNVDDWYTTMLAQRKWLDDPGAYGGGLNKEYVIRRYSDVEHVLRHLSTKLETRFFPILDAYETLEGLDALLNPAELSSSVFSDLPESGFCNVITAFLARNPRLEAICEECLSRVKAEKYRIPILRCIEYVRGARAT